MRLSRWGQSAYETDADVAQEAQELASMVQVVESGEDAEIVVVHSKIRFGRAELARAPSCQLVITTTSGTDHLDLALLSQRRVEAARLPLARRDAVVETALMMLLWGLRAAGPMQAAAADGRWVRGELPKLNMRLLQDSRVGLLGLGVIGTRMAQVLSLLGADVVGLDPAGLPPGVAEVNIDGLLDCDVLSLHCDLNSTTTGMIDSARLAKARPGLVLVNTARGSLVDVRAATEAVQSGSLGALALDVFPEEPWPGLESLANVPRVMVLPHAAGFHSGLADCVRSALLQTVEAWAKEEPLPYPAGKPSR
jgi:D-3-phosphoglycerate dehydrogenase